MVPPQLCDIYEPSDSRYTNQKKITRAAQGQVLSRNDTEDNYYFDLSANTRITITLDIPRWKGKTVFYVYKSKPDYAFQTASFWLCEWAAWTQPRPGLRRAAGILGPDRYVVRLYTNNSATDYDNANQYTLLLVASQ